MPGPYFADTFYWVAFTNRRDAWHSRVRAWGNAHPSARLVTTEEVLAEVVNWFAGSGPAGRAHAATAVRTIRGDPLTQVLPQTTFGFDTALALYEARLDKGTAWRARA